MPTIIEELELPGEAETIEELPLPRNGNRLVTGLKRLVGREEPIEELPLPRRQPYEDRFPVADGLTPEERAKRETWGGLTEAEKLQTDVARIGRYQRCLCLLVKLCLPLARTIYRVMDVFEGQVKAQCE